MSDFPSSRAQARPVPASRKFVTEAWLFPLAACYGAISVPAFVLGRVGMAPAPPGLGSAAGHAHELLFGYALAVMTAFLVNRVSGPRLAALVALWITARVAFLFLPGSLLAPAANVGFAGLAAATAAPRFMKAAKKWRNRLIGPLVLAICAAVAAFQLLLTRGGGFMLYVVLGEAVVLFALLMLFFGGRLIAPAAAGAIERAGGRLEARVQPRIEGAIMLVMIGAFLTGPLPALQALHGLLLVLAGGLAIVRLLRWRLWACAGRPDLICLGLGYAWLGAGLVLLGAARGLDGWLSPGVVTHAITVGALGTLTTNVMLRTRLLRLRIDLGRAAPAFIAMTSLVSLAALGRLLGAVSAAGLLFAAAAWALALALLLVMLLRFRRPAQPSSANANNRST